jgi:threonine dehydratase
MPSKGLLKRSRKESSATPASLRVALERAQHLVYAALTPTPQLQWALLSERVGTDLWTKHENHNPTGSFKLRGGVVYMDWLRVAEPETRGVIAATRGNFGQSVAFAARRAGLEPVVVVPHGNSREKNAAMRALGAEVIEHGRDFQEAYEHTRRLADERGLHFLRSFHPLLWHGTASYGLELLRAVPELDVIYVPIGQGSGICGVIAARDALERRTQVVGVVAENAAAYALSFDAGHSISTDSANTIADGMACRVPDDDAFGMIRKGAARIVTVSEAEIRAAMRYYFSDTHNVAEGAGAAPLAAALKEREVVKGKKVGLVLSGGNVDRAVFAEVLQEQA